MSKHKTKSEALSRGGFLGLTDCPPRILNEVELTNPFVLATITHMQDQFGSPVFDQCVLELTGRGGSAACQTSARMAIDQACSRLDNGLVWQWAHEAMQAHSSQSGNWAQTPEQMANASSTQDLPPDWNERRRAVLNRDRCRCAICGGSLKTHSDIHHIVHRSRGGCHHWTNLASLCHKCHRVLEGHEGMNRPGFRLDDHRRIVHSKNCRLEGSARVAEDAPNGYRPCQKCRPFKGSKAYSQVTFNSRRMKRAPMVMKHLRQEHPPSPEIVRQARLLVPDICVYRRVAPQGRKKIKRGNLEVIGGTLHLQSNLISMEGQIAGAAR